MIVDHIMRAAAEKAQQRQGRPSKLGAWNIGRCVRQLWYGEHGHIPEPMQARSMLVFDLGDRIEDAVIHWLLAAKVPHIRTNESRDMVHVAEIGGRVRSDFFFQYDAEPLWTDRELGELALVAGDEMPPQPGELLVADVKSMSNYGFEQAQRGTVDEAYAAQMEVYMRAYNVRHALIVAYRKETSSLCEILIPRNAERWQRIIEAARIARAAECPQRPFALDAACHGQKDGTCVEGLTPKTGKPHKRCGGTGQEPGGPYIQTFPCGYCGYKTTCWSDLGQLELTFRDGRPVWRIDQRDAA